MTAATACPARGRYLPRMLTGAERNSLALTLGFLVLGSGIKLWKRATAEIGPFPTPSAEAVSAGLAGTADLPAAAPASVPDAIPGKVPGTVPDKADTDGADPDSAADAGDAAGPDDTSTTGSGSFREASGQGRGRGNGASRESAARRKAPPAGKVDANRATAAELATVPGIGPRIAAAIVAYRRERGSFLELGQLREVKGIGEKKWAAIAPCLTLAAARGGAPGDTAGTGPETGPKPVPMKDGDRVIGDR